MYADDPRPFGGVLLTWINRNLAFGRRYEVTKMKHLWKMLLAATLCLTLIMPYGVMAEETARYGVVTDVQVNVRKTDEGMASDIWFKVDEGHVGQILDKVEDRKGQYEWYKVETTHPIPNGRTYIGYIREDCFREMTAAEVEEYLKSQETPDTGDEDDNTEMQPSVDDALGGGTEHVEYSGIEVVGGKGKILVDSNFRSKPTTKEGEIYCVIPKGTEVEISAIPLEDDANGWYRVKYDGETGYVFNDLIELLDAGSEPTPDPGYGTEVSGVIGEVTTDKVNFRNEPKKDTNNANVIQKLNEGDQVEVLTVPDGTTTSDWYRVRYNGVVGYIQAPFIRIVSGETPKPELPDQGDGEVTIVATGEIIADKVNFRMSASKAASIYGKLYTGEVVQLLSIPTKIDEEHWYKVKHNGKTGYIQSPYIRVLMVDEDSLPAPEKFGYAKLLEDSVNLRATPGGDTVLQWKGKGTLLRITGEPVYNSNYDWYPVYYANTHGVYYVREDMIQVMAVKDGELVTPTPPPASPYGYVVTTKTGVNLRIQPGEKSLTQVPINTILACVGPSQSPAESDTSYTWYKVKYNGVTGYLRGDCVRVCTSTGGSIVDPEPDDPEETTPPEEEVIYGYIRLVKDNVNLRNTELGYSKGQYPLGLILPVIAETTPAGLHGQHCWYKVRTADGKVGFIRGDCAVWCDENGTEVTPPAPPAGEEVTGVKGKLLKNTNFRDAAGYHGNIDALIPAGTIVDVLEIPANKVNGWYKIVYEGETGYVLASLLEVVTEGEDTKPPVSAYGYVMINDEKVNFRRTAATGDNVIKQLDKGTVWPMTGVKEVKNGITWYPIDVNGQKGYVHGDFSFKLSPTQEESYLAGNGVPEEDPTPDEVMSSYIITTYDDVNLRSNCSLDATRKYQVDKGVVIPFNGTKDIGTVTWYSIVYEHEALWVHGNYVRVLTEKEYQDWLAQNPDEEPDAETSKGYVKLIMDNVYIRQTAAGTTIDQLRLDTVLPYYAESIPGGGYNWYRVKTPKGEIGYIRSDMVAKCYENGELLPPPTPEQGEYTSAPQMQQMTTYYSLKVGSTGVRVKNLVQELINQGYYTGEVTENYTTLVAEAVKRFQAVKGLTVDGKAGSATQHALFGTRPDKAGDTSNMEFEIYPVEKIDWFTGGIQEMIPRGAKFKIYDVRTGIVWWAYRQAGGNHMDIETLTAADSKRLCEIYGVSNLQQVVDENMWYPRRACLVTIGTRTFACSLDGMQHGTDTISNNGMDGQVCLHFTNSTGHSNGGQVSTSHAEAIEYAYKNAPYGQKK